MTESIALRTADDASNHQFLISVWIKCGSGSRCSPTPGREGAMGNHSTRGLGLGRRPRGEFPVSDGVERLSEDYQRAAAASTP